MSPGPRPATAARRRAVVPKYDKPAGSCCDTCPMARHGVGFVPADGPTNARIILVGEAAGYDEATTGAPFVGAAGSMLTRLLRVIGRQREQYRIDNCVRCVPPDFDLEKFPGAVQHCTHLDGTLESAPDDAVLIALGAVPMRRLLGLAKHKDVRLQDFHGTVTRVGRHWVVPTFHPSHLQRGATNLFGVVVSDLARAHEVAKDGWAEDPGTLVIDPPLPWFRAWADQYLAAVRQDPWAYPLAVDIETPDKGTDEGTLVGTDDDASYEIKRVNLSCHPDEGVTVVPDPGYWEIICEVLAAAGPKQFWFKHFDEPRLRARGASWDPALSLDLMWMAKVLQSDLPMGLGFWAPFYSRWGAWKHLSEGEPAKYAAIDALQTRRVGEGLTADLVKAGRWEVFARHLHDFHRVVLQPATDIGVAVDRERLAAFRAKLDAHASRLLDQIAEVGGDGPLVPAAGLTRPPAPEAIYTKARDTKADGTAKKDPPDPLKMALYSRSRVVEKIVLREVGVCKACGAVDVAKTHRCDVSRGSLWAGDDGKLVAPIVEKKVASVRRWFWQEPFNPDSPDQLLTYAAAHKHQPGKAKGTGNPSMDRETLGTLIRETGDPLYSAVLDYRAVAKVRGTYVVGTEKRLDGNDRLHPSFTFKPSTMRLASQNPNIQNVVADKGGEETLAAGFRHAVVARGQETPDQEYQDRAPAVWASAKLLEFDYAGIEQVVMGWCMNAPAYIRIAKLGTHAIVASHVLAGEKGSRWTPADLTLPDQQIGAYLKTIKGSDDAHVGEIYDRSKRCVHGTAYGLTTYGMVRNFPQTFSTLKDAEKIQRVYFELAPDVPAFHTAVRHTAHLQHFLGGAEQYTYRPDEPEPDRPRVIGHPYGYQHWFWSVVSYQRLSDSQRQWREKRRMPLFETKGVWYGATLGEDAKRVVAYYPQSISRGVLTEGAFPLFDPEDPLAGECYIGAVYFGQTPLRAPIHDSLLLEVPTRKVDWVTERVLRAMGRPVEALPCPEEWGIGPYLTVGVDGKIGDDWGAMEKLRLPEMPGVAGDVGASPTDEEAEVEIGELGTKWGAA